MRAKMILVLLLVSQVPLIVISAFTVFTARRALLHQAAINMGSVGNGVAREIDAKLSGWREDIVTVSQLPAIVAYASSLKEAEDPAAAGRPIGKAAKALRDSLVQTAVMELKAAAARPNYESVAVVNPQGRIVLSSLVADVNLDISFRPFFIDAMKGNPQISEPSVAVATGRPSLFVSAPVRDADGQVIAVVRSRLNLYAIWDLVEQAAERSVPGTVAMLLDNNGIRIAHSASKGNRDLVVNTLLYRAVAPLPDAVVKGLIAEKRFGRAATDRVEVLPLPEVAAALQHPVATTFEASADNSTLRHQSAAVPLKTKVWRLALQAPQPSFTSAATSMTQISVAAAIGFGLLSVLAAYIIARGITKPLVQLTEVADRISLGELDARVQIERKDEIGDLAEALRRMQTSLQTAIERLRARRTA
jgi:C4-dicarboxylate-specific signal transduction histidine kinase